MTGLTTILLIIFIILTGIFAFISVRLGIIDKIKQNRANNFEVENHLLSSSFKDLTKDEDNIKKYYTEILIQAKISFFFSIAAASTGFSIIILAILQFPSTDIASSIISTIAGTILNAVSSLFFLQSKRTQKYMTEYLDKLREDKKSLLAKEICETIDDDELKSKLKAYLTLQYSGIKQSKNLTDIISKITNEN